MRILINASNLKLGGGVQVADSFCRDLRRFNHHHFVVVLSSAMYSTRTFLVQEKVADVFSYDIQDSLSTFLFGRDAFLDELVELNKIDVVLTIFGPSRWIPKCPHLSGFARSHLVIPESPFFAQKNWIQRFKNRIRNCLLTCSFRRSTRYFFTENLYISNRLEKLFIGSKVFTITNYYHQIFDHEDQWVKKELPAFHGTTMLTISAAYPHKNLPITLAIARIWKKQHPDFNFRFVLTVEASELPPIDEALQSHFVLLGKVSITECPALYQQCDIMFLPSLLECFSATYPEAMKMRCPIVTTDMEFAHGLCGDAALYYSPTSAEEAANTLYTLAKDEALQAKLMEAGTAQLSNFDNYNQRSEKLIHILELLSDKYR